ncbi:28 kDa ribonucleoprotein, chloroplastic [Mercurialis annua]|uniref:28 kDa ribonucleoprotein, chloroplastic n=1 Tax=Mercurialis annua TaxID=3986 RepID=UPI00215F8FF5|nr:28 kDa ribonucleoprotein, chloroplastic [Mercurialis annua]
MAATAAAAVSSSFSPSMHTLKRTNFKHFPSDSYSLKFPSARISFASIYYNHRYFIEPVSGRRLVSAAVAQDQEEAVTAPVGDDEQRELGEKGEVEAKSEAEVINTKLYFGNLPYNIDSAQLAGIVQDHGTPELVEVLYDRNTGRSRGFAFVTMSNVEDCNAVIENLDGSQYMGRILRVNFSDKPKSKEPLYPETEYKLFVGNLSWSVTSESLTEAFQEYGNVIGARVLYDGETGKSRGYGFVCYPTREEMEKALESLNGVEVEGRALRVSLAEGKKS